MPEGNLLSFSKLESGMYNISFRAKKYGNFKWSEENTYQFIVQKAIIETLWFKISIILLAILLVFATRFLTATILRRRQRSLEKLVDERTNELAVAIDNLKYRNQELDQFVYSTSHDLVAPLKSMKGLIYLAKQEEDPALQQALLTKMNSSVLKLEKFIKDVISYSRNARLGIVKEPIDLNLIVNGILEDISSLPNFSKIKFELLMDKKCVIDSDEIRIKIILNNLISNAVKFQKYDNGHNPWIKIAYKLEDGKNILTIADNGQGIKDEFKEDIFKMFFRANYNADGSGLGLYILQRTINKLKGTITLNSQINVGSEFVITFP